MHVACNAAEALNDFPELMAHATRAVRLASTLCKRTQFELRNNEKVAKLDDSPVTVADFAAQAVVSLVLERAAPSVGLVAEESASDMRSDGGAVLRRRVTEKVNETLAEEFERTFSEDEVMDAIDRGQTEGGASG